MRFEIWPPRRKPALIPHELLCKRVSQGGISKAPTNCPTSIISATVTALRGYSVPRVKIIHCCQLGPEAARRHRYIHEVRKILFDLFGSPTSSMAVHIISLIKKRDLAIDVNQISARPTYAPFISMMPRSRTARSIIVAAAIATNEALRGFTIPNSYWPWNGKSHQSS